MHFWGETQRNLYVNECRGPVDAIRSVPGFSSNNTDLEFILKSLFAEIDVKNTVNFQRWKLSIYRDEPTLHTVLS